MPLHARLRAALACLQGKAVIVNTHTYGFRFVIENPKGHLIANNTTGGLR